MRHSKMAEWMENVEKAISRIMADKVYTSAEFKRERDNFHALCKDLERAEVKKWLAHSLEILMAERAKDQRKNEFDKLEMVIKRQEKSLTQLETKRGVVKDLIEKGKQILVNPDKPKFLEGHVQRIEVGWDDTKNKAQDRLTLLQETKNAWVGYAENNETIVTEFEKGEEEIKRVKKRFNLEAALDDLKKRQDIFKKTNDSIMGLFNTIRANLDCMSITLPEDKKKILEKEVKAVEEKLEVVGRFKDKVTKVEDFCKALGDFDASLKVIKGWMENATSELNDIKSAAGSMLPEDRVARTMDLQEDITSKVEILKTNAATEQELLPQGDKVPQDAQDYKDELNRITKYVMDLEAKTN